MEAGREKHRAWTSFPEIWLAWNLREPQNTDMIDSLEEKSETKRAMIFFIPVFLGVDSKKISEGMMFNSPKDSHYLCCLAGAWQKIKKEKAFERWSTCHKTIKSLLFLSFLDCKSFWILLSCCMQSRERQITGINAYLWSLSLRINSCLKLLSYCFLDRVLKDKGQCIHEISVRSLGKLLGSQIESSQAESEPLMQKLPGPSYEISENLLTVDVWCLPNKNLQAQRSDIFMTYISSFLVPHVSFFCDICVLCGTWKRKMSRNIAILWSLLQPNLWSSSLGMWIKGWCCRRLS